MIVHGDADQSNGQGHLPANDNARQHITSKGI